MDDLSPAEQRQILVDEVWHLNAILETEGWNAAGYHGQPRPHWALPARRAALDAIRKLDRQSPPDAVQTTELEDFLAR